MNRHVNRGELELDLFRPFLELEFDPEADEVAYGR